MTDFNLVLSQVRQRLEILYQIVDELEAQGGGGGQGGTDNYNELTNKPKINNVTLSGNKTGEDLGLADYAALADKADKSTTYTKTQVDGLLDDKADKSTTYTKTEVDTALNGKADAATTYTKTETDAEIASGIVGAINDLDVTAVGGSTKYLTTISEANGLIDATAASPDTVPTTSSTKLITSGGVKTYVDNAKTAANAYTDTECGAIANAGAKNLSRAAFTSNNNIYGIAFTANADGTVVATGTATAVATLQSSTFILKAGTYIFSCSENPQRDTTYDAYVYNIDTSTTLARDNPDDSPGTTFTLAQDATVRINLRIANGYTANNVVFKPMIRDAVIVDATYQPPTLTNTELNESKITMLNILGAGQRITATQSEPIDLNNYTSVGRFNWLSNVTQYMTNLPVSGKGGLLEVSYIQGTSTILHKVYLSDGANSPIVFYQRFRYGSPGTWTPWYVFTGTEVQAANAQTTNLGGEMRSVASLEESDIEPIEEPQEER